MAGVSPLLAGVMAGLLGAGGGIVIVPVLSQLLALLGVAVATPAAAADASPLSSDGKGEAQAHGGSFSPGRGTWDPPW